MGLMLSPHALFFSFLFACLLVTLDLKRGDLVEKDNPVLSRKICTCKQLPGNHVD